MISSKKIGEYIRKQRKLQQLTQKELAKELNISFQAVSKWENGDTLPDVSILLNLADILNTTTDKILSGGQIIVSNHKFIDMSHIVDGFKALENLRYYFGKESSFYQGAIEGINKSMNIDFEQYIKDDRYKEVMFAEVIIQYLMNGYTMDLDDIKQHITSEKMIGIIGKYLGKESTIKHLRYQENKSLFDQIRLIKPAFENLDTLNELPGEYIGMDAGKTYWGTQIETNEEWCYGIAVDEKSIYVFTYEAHGKNQTLIHKEDIKK